MKNSWINWAIIISILLIVVIGINYQNSQNNISLNDVFKDDKSMPADMDYEYVDNAATNAATAAKSMPAAGNQPAPAAKTMPAKIKEIPAVQPAASVQPAVSAKPSEAIASTLDAVSFTIQVLSSKDQGKAEKKLEEIKKKGYDAFISAKNLGDKGQWYRVYVGKFNTKPEAETMLKGVEADYPGSFIISPNKKK